MFRISGIISVLVAIFCAAILFWTSQSVQRAEKKLSDVTSYSLNEKESLRVLSAEWDYLNRPDRLEELTSGNLDLDTPAINGKVFVEGGDEIPEPKVPALPKIKPSNLLQHVATQNKATTAVKKQPTIEKQDSPNFDKILNNIAAGGQP